MGSPTRPGKRTDTRHAEFTRIYGDASVGLDALPPNVLTEMVEDMIVSEIDVDEWNKIIETEQLERETLQSLSAVAWKPGTHYKIA